MKSLLIPSTVWILVALLTTCHSTHAKDVPRSPPAVMATENSSIPDGQQYTYDKTKQIFLKNDTELVHLVEGQKQGISQYPGYGYPGQQPGYGGAQQPSYPGYYPTPQPRCPQTQCPTTCPIVPIITPPPYNECRCPPPGPFRCPPPPPIQCPPPPPVHCPGPPVLHCPAPLPCTSVVVTQRPYITTYPPCQVGNCPTAAPPCPYPGPCPYTSPPTTGCGAWPCNVNPGVVYQG